MQENLVIVESPAKAKTIEKFLGKDYIVKSSFGHIRDLSKKDLGINIAEGFRPIYEVPTDKKKVVDELARLSKEKTVWLASDEDREGEAIAWHLTEVLGLPVDQTKRIVFHEITKRAILEAGRRRLKAIVMTSLTTILAVAPFLARGDMGSDLQFPMSLVIISGMTVGTLVSVLFIPLAYYEIHKPRR